MTPDGWAVRRIGEFCVRVRRINEAGLDLEPFSVTKDRGVVLQSEKYNKRIATDPKKYQIGEDGDFAFDPMSLYYGSIGRVSNLGRGLVSPDYVTFQADSSVDAGFLERLLRFPEMHKVYESLSETGNSFGKRRRLYWSIFQDIPLLLPPLPEQRKIAAILSSVDEAIESTRAVIDQLGVVKKAMMSELLTRGIPGRHKRFKMTEIGEIPEEWEIGCVEEFAKINTGDKDTQNRVPDGEYPFIVRSQTVERINSWSFDGEAVLTAGDGVGTGKVFHYMEGRFDYHQRVYNIHEFRPNVLGRFFFYYFSLRFIEQVRKYSAKNSVDSVRRAMIARMAIPIPPLEEQRCIAETLSGVDRRVDAETRTLSAAALLKTALMFVLLTGEVRVRPDVDAA